MSSEQNELTIAVSEDARAMLDRVAAIKGVTPQTAAAEMVRFAGRLLEEGALQKGTELVADLDFARASRTQVMRRADQLLGVAEKVNLEAQGLQRALRNRFFGT